MKFTLSWLKDHLETEASIDRLTEALTALGLEVEERRLVRRVELVLAQRALAARRVVAPDLQGDLH